MATRAGEADEVAPRWQLARGGGAGRRGVATDSEPERGHRALVDAHRREDEPPAFGRRDRRSRGVDERRGEGAGRAASQIEDLGRRAERVASRRDHEGARVRRLRARRDRHVASEDGVAPCRAALGHEVRRRARIRVEDRVRRRGARRAEPGAGEVAAEARLFPDRELLRRAPLERVAEVEAGDRRVLLVHQRGANEERSRPRGELVARHDAEALFVELVPARLDPRAALGVDAAVERVVDRLAREDAEAAEHLAELVAARGRIGGVDDVAAALREAAAAPELVDDHGDLAVLDQEITDAPRGERAREGVLRAGDALHPRRGELLCPWITAEALTGRVSVTPSTHDTEALRGAGPDLDSAVLDRRRAGCARGDQGQEKPPTEGAGAHGEVAHSLVRTRRRAEPWKCGRTRRAILVDRSPFFTE